MSTVVSNLETRILLDGIAWSSFDDLSRCDDAGDRFAYDRGTLEIMSPSVEHDRLSRALLRIVQLVTMELNIPILSGGSVTLKSELKQRGAEADESFFVTHAAEVIRQGTKNYDSSVGPPPDLVIEVGLTRSPLDKRAIYSELGVPELWMFEKGMLRMCHLQPDGTYVSRDRSLSFPFLLASDVQRLIDASEGIDETTWIRSFRDWVKTLKAE